MTSASANSCEAIVVPALVMTETFVNVAVHKALLLWLVTTNPTNTVELIETATGDPRGVHVDPFVEVYAENVPPFLTSLTQPGTTAPALLADVEPPVVSRRWKLAFPEGVRMAAAFLEFGCRLSRIITPALAHVLVLVMPVTLARMSQLPLTD